MAEGKKTPIDAGMIARVVRGITSWFGPGKPLAPVAPEETRGRQWDYPFAVNMTQRPRQEQGETGIDFATLRALSDPTGGGLDLLRLAIETRKDQMEAQRWHLVARDGSDGGDKARAIEQAMRTPDLEHTRSQWQRMLLEDLLVIDAPCIYLAPSTKGYKVPQVMDGALLKRLVREDGRTPLPPEMAFQQVLKGVPGVEYTLDELVYLPRNLRSYRLYGMSPVEQVVMTVSIALRRQLSQLEYYTAGSIPDVIMTAPESWSADQIKQFQQWWDSILSGNSEERRRARFVPGGVKPYELKPDALKDQFDEWLARVICYAFNLSPQALVPQMNRATADTAKESAQEEGLEPLKHWWKDLVDTVLARGFDAGELELAYEDEEIADPQTKANVWSTLTGKKALFTQDEGRAAYGAPPLTPEQKDELSPAVPAALVPGQVGQVPGQGGGAQPAESEPKPGAEKMRKVEFQRDASGRITGATLRG